MIFKKDQKQNQWYPIIPHKLWERMPVALCIVTIWAFALTAHQCHCRRPLRHWQRPSPAPPPSCLPLPPRLCLDSFLQTAAPSTIPFFTPLGIKTTTKDFSSHARLKDPNSLLNLDWLHLFWFLSGHGDSGKGTCQPQNDSKSYFYDSKSPVSQLERGSCAK